MVFLRNQFGIYVFIILLIRNSKMSSLLVKVPRKACPQGFDIWNSYLHHLATATIDKQGGFSKVITRWKFENVWWPARYFPMQWNFQKIGVWAHRIFHEKTNSNIHYFDFIPQQIFSRPSCFSKQKQKSTLKNHWKLIFLKMGGPKNFKLTP